MKSSIDIDHKSQRHACQCRRSDLSMPANKHEVKQQSRANILAATDRKDVRAAYYNVWGLPLLYSVLLLTRARVSIVSLMPTVNNWAQSGKASEVECAGLCRLFWKEGKGFGARWLIMLCFRVMAWYVKLHETIVWTSVVTVAGKQSTSAETIDRTRA